MTKPPRCPPDTTRALTWVLLRRRPAVSAATAARFDAAARKRAAWAAGVLPPTEDEWRRVVGLLGDAEGAFGVGAS